MFRVCGFVPDQEFNRTLLEMTGYWPLNVAAVFPRACSICCHVRDGGAEGIRTPDPHNAIVVLYQLSYDPIRSAG